jgi:hypothetical protein
MKYRDSLKRNFQNGKFRIRQLYSDSQKLFLDMRIEFRVERQL